MKTTLRFADNRTEAVSANQMTVGKPYRIHATNKNNEYHGQLAIRYVNSLRGVDSIFVAINSELKYPVIFSTKDFQNGGYKFELINTKVVLTFNDVD
jgi:hypothetical protein